MKTTLLLTALFCAATLGSFAEEDAAKNRLDQIFKNFDTNGDGGISLAEYKAGMGGNMAQERVAGVFKEKDRNGDGKLSKEELLVVPKDQQSPAPGRKDEKKK